MTRVWVLAAVLAAMSPRVQAASDALATVTILEGAAQVLRASGRVHAMEGLRLAGGDVVETDAKAFAQIELQPQGVLQLGPSTQVLFGAPVARKGVERSLYVLAGWAKLIGAPRDQPGFELRSPLLELPAGPAVVVLRAAPGEARLFVERGDVRLTERQSKGNAVVVALQAGDRYQRKENARGVVNAGTLAAFSQDMPRQFRDALPLRLARYGDRDPAPAPAPDFTYAEVEGWLKSESALRRGFMQRWRAKARDGAFRAALVSNLAAHPEWDPVLFPEKYLPKEPPRRTVAAPAPAASASAR